MIENRISDRAKILLIDEDTSISYLIRRAMEKENYKIYIAGSGKQGMEMSTGVCPDLILMDNKFSDMEGITLIQWFREWTDCPIIILSERSSYLDKVEALYAGADDYMVKPFLPKELSLRIGIILRRYYKGEDPIVQLAGSQIDFDRAEVIKENEHFPLTAKEHDILLALYRNAGRIVTIDQLCEAAWGDNPYGYENSLMAHIRRIREKIEANPSKPVSLITVKGLGYKLVLAGK